MASILIAGSSGLIGKELSKLLSKSYTIHHLSRNKSASQKHNTYFWNPVTNEIDAAAFKDVISVINLSGENISNKRWTPKQKTKIQESRTDTTKNLLDGIKEFGSTTTSYISASATGFYGSNNVEHIHTEVDLPGNDFLAETCVKWELSGLRRIDIKVRKVYIRTGIVLSNSGGFLQKILLTLPFRFIVQFGNGNQYMPWIHIEDLCEIYKLALENENMSGIYNAVSSEHITQNSLIKNIQKSIKKRIILVKIPTFATQWIFGELSQLLLQGNKVSNKKLIDLGFKFTYDNILKAIQVTI